MHEETCGYMHVSKTDHGAQHFYGCRSFQAHAAHSLSHFNDTQCTQHSPLSSLVARELRERDKTA